MASLHIPIGIHFNNNNNNNKLTEPSPITSQTFVIRDNEKGTCMLIDVAIPGDRNVIQKEAEKMLKYKDLTIEIQRNNWSDCNHFKIIQKIREHHTRKPWS
jgi:hypothetical protein